MSNDEAVISAARTGGAPDSSVSMLTENERTAPMDSSDSRACQRSKSSIEDRSGSWPSTS
jgi:hypothetical protein